jgi:hypothetical protein
VETTEHGLLLLALGCDLAQGFGIAPPMAPERFIEWARHWSPDPAWTGDAADRTDAPALIASGASLTV